LVHGQWFWEENTNGCELDMHEVTYRDVCDHYLKGKAKEMTDNQHMALEY